jgi:uncharacterized protein YecE (DUF72 family)
VDPQHRAPLYVGPSGWHYADWQGVFYPAGTSRDFDALAFMTRYFTALEVNSSFYRPPTARMAASWVRRVPPAPTFRFAVKLWQRFTHARDEPFTAADVDLFKEGIKPLHRSGHLGCLLLQFPWSFRWSPAASEWLARLADAFREYLPVVEIRHVSWDTPDARDCLRMLGLSYCNIDQPQLNQCIGPSAHVTGPIGYFRLHGRRTDTWFAANARTHERYDYLYTEKELAGWVDHIRYVGDQTNGAYVFTNNHYRGQAPANALQLRSMLASGKVAVPPLMLDHFPFLADRAKPSEPSRPAQPELF